MKTIEQQIAVMQHFADGGEVERTYLHGTGWIQVEPHAFDWASFDYRIKEAVDPYAELKAAAADPTKQVRVKGRRWVDGGDRSNDWTWKRRLDQYEIRNKPRTVKLLAWFNGTRMDWSTDTQRSESWKRVPAEDKTIEVES